MFARLKHLYATITLTRTTTSYFCIASLSCIALVILQIVVHTDNSIAADLVSELLTAGNITRGIVVASDDGQRLRICDDLPFIKGSNCWTLVEKGKFTAEDDKRKLASSQGVGAENAAYIYPPERRDHLDVSAILSSSGDIDGVVVNGEVLNRQCLSSLLWLDNIVRDSIKEDFVTLFFQIWLLVLSGIAIVNESLPHLGAALCGHILAVAWAGYRISNSKHLGSLYLVLIAKGACQMDLLGPWWNLRESHTIPVIVFNSLALSTMLYFSFRLFQTYTKQTLGRVGASPKIAHVYNLVLIFSVFLQLSAFFLLASTSIWIAKVSTGAMRLVAHHLPLYLAGFGITAILSIPWVVLGWYSVRREKRVLFYVFCGISVVLIVIAIAMFSSPLYMYIFQSWPFFASVTVTSFILLVISIGMGVVCRLYFGVGLSQFLEVSNILSGMGFTEAYFPADKDVFDEKSADMHDAKELDFSSISQVMKEQKAHSIFSDVNKATIHVSTTPGVARSDTSLSFSSKFSHRLSTFSGKSTAPSSNVDATSQNSGRVYGNPNALKSGGRNMIPSMSSVSTMHWQDRVGTGVPPVPRMPNSARRSLRPRPGLVIDTELATNGRSAMVLKVKGFKTEISAPSNALLHAER